MSRTDGCTSDGPSRDRATCIPARPETSRAVPGFIPASLSRLSSPRSVRILLPEPRAYPRVILLPSRDPLGAGPRETPRATRDPSVDVREDHPRRLRSPPAVDVKLERVLLRPAKVTVHPRAGQPPRRGMRDALYHPSFSFFIRDSRKNGSLSWPACDSDGAIAPRGRRERAGRGIGAEGWGESEIGVVVSDVRSRGQRRGRARRRTWPRSRRRHPAG